MKSVVILPNWVGDTVLALPVLSALAATGRRLAVVGKSHLAPLLESQATIDAFIPRGESDADGARRVREFGGDEAVVLPNSIRSAKIAYQADLPIRWGYAGWSVEGLVRRRLLRPAVPAPEDWTPRLDLSAAQRREGRELLARAQIATNRRPLIGLFAGAEFGPSKRWPWRRFAELTHRMRRDLPGCQLAILAGPKETWLAVRIHEESGKIHPVVGPDLDLGRLAALIARLDLLITNDSGPMHMAAALGIPCLAVFGPTDPRRTRPVGQEHRVLYSKRWCSPCFRRRCPLIHHRCMRDITVETVADSAGAMLSA